MDGGKKVSRRRKAPIRAVFKVATDNVTKIAGEGGENRCRSAEVRDKREKRRRNRGCSGWILVKRK